MQMRKKILATALVATMVFGLVGCGSGSGDGSQASNSGSDSSAKTQTGEFNPDTVEDSMTIEEIRQNLGDEVKVKSGLQLGAIAKSFSNEFWRNFKNGYEAAEKSLKDAGVDAKIKVDGTTDESDEIGQQTMTDNLVNQGYNALMLSPISDSNLTSSVDNAKTKKIPTINVNDGLISAADYFVGPDAYQNGELAAEWVSKQLGDKGEVAIVVGMAKAFAARERTAGFKGWIKDNNSGLKVVAEQNADWDRQKAKELASTWIQQNPDLKAIFCNNDDMALGVVEAVEEAKADILVVGVDGIGEAYDSIREGKLDATVDSFGYYMSQVATEVTLRVLAGQDIPRVTHTPQALIDSTNVDKDAAEIIGWTDAKYVAE
ncbi:MAG: substrate-binding domain-containing protein [Eubacterium sp.]|nr:substrate-binding domain-containing protein [Eubacterium sp.]